MNFVIYPAIDLRGGKSCALAGRGSRSHDRLQ